MGGRGRAYINHFAEMQDHRVALHPLDAGGDRRGAAVERLYEVDVHRHRERGVAADAHDTDGAGGHAQFGGRTFRKKLREGTIDVAK